MDKIIVTGPAKLSGEVLVSRAKNACLPIMFGTLLSNEIVELKQLPELVDVKTTLKLLTDLGVCIEKGNDSWIFDSRNTHKFEANYDLVKTMRASILVLGPLLAKYRTAKVSLPGGCAIGSRPIDIHLKGLEAMGADISLKSGYVEASTKGLKGASILLPFPSVGATENLMMAAALAEGTTTIDNAAKEPEIEDLAHFINSMGGKVSGAGTAHIKVEGVSSLGKTSYSPIGDRIEAATFVIAGIMTNSNIVVNGVDPSHLDSIITVLNEMGANLKVGRKCIEVFPLESALKGVEIITAPYPGVPTDVQAQLMALSCICQTPSVISEKIFENRFMHVPELRRLGAKIILKGSSAIIEGSSQFTGAPVMCTDLRASAALILSALVADGDTEIRRVYHLDRGYEKIDDKLRKLGVTLTRVKS